MVFSLLFFDSDILRPQEVSTHSMFPLSKLLPCQTVSVIIHVHGMHVYVTCPNVPTQIVMKLVTQMKETQTCWSLMEPQIERINAVR